MRRWAYLLGFLVLAYVLSFGPVVYGLSACERRYHGGMVRRIGTIVVYGYYPHVLAMRWSYAYYRYGLWWAGLAYGGIGADEGSWKAWRSRPLDP